MSRAAIAAMMFTLAALVAPRASSQPMLKTRVASHDRRFLASFSKETTQSLGPKRDGADMEIAVKAKLERDARFSRVAKVEVNPAKGLVRLSGRVANEADRSAAGKLVSSVKGVAMIYNELEVENGSDVR